MPTDMLSHHTQQETLAILIERFTTGTDGVYVSPLSSLTLYRASCPSDVTHAIYEPALCIIAQGTKQVILADEMYVYDPARYLLGSIELPVASRITEASPRKPYLSLKLDLDPGQITALIMETGLSMAKKSGPGRALAVSPLEPQLLDAAIRLARLLETPQDIPVMGPLLTREILYRLLLGDQGERLRQIASGNSQTQRISRAINWLKQNYNRPFHIEEIAREAYMSPSGLHHHFKAVTAMSPLQYQKQLRLQEARRLMLSEGIDATTASYQVGYESPSQFSREYSRLFGAPPLRDVTALRNASLVLLES